MECLGPECVSMLLEWMKTRTAGLDLTTGIERTPECPARRPVYVRRLSGGRSRRSHAGRVRGSSSTWNMPFFEDIRTS